MRDQRRREDRDRGEPDEHGHRGTGDRGDRVVVVPQSVLAATGVDPAPWWRGATEYLENMGALAISRWRRAPSAALRPMGDCDVITLLASEVFRGALCADRFALQRFSAVTSNAHRIHYDYPYATMVEGYPDLVVHGPLVLLSLLELLRLDYPSRRVTDVDFTASTPVFCGDEVLLIGTPDGDEITLHASVNGHVAMTAVVRLAPA